MKNKKWHLLCACVCTVLLLGACEEKEQTTPSDELKNDAEIVLNEPINPLEEDTTKETTKQNEEKMVVAFVGEKWENQEQVSFVKGDWNNSLPKDSRFVLIPQEENISKEKQAMLQTWLKDDKVILFYGENVQPEEVKEKLGMEIGTIEVKSDASFDFPYLLYGYGFSMTYEQYLPIFLGSNTYTGFEEKIANFLIKNKNF